MVEAFQDDREKIELFVSCRSLKSADNRNGYQIKMYTKSQSSNWSEFGKTESIYDNWNPNFVKTFIVDYIFEMQQYVKFELINTENKGSILASTETSIGAIVGAKNQTLISDLKDSQGNWVGKIVFRCDKVMNSSESVFFKIRGRKIANQRFFLFNSSPFLRFYRIKEGNVSSLLVYQSEPIEHNLNPIWAPIDINMGKLCNGDHLLPIKLEVWDNRSSGQHTYIAETTFTIKELEETKNKELVLRNPKRKKENQGIIIIDHISLKYQPQFYDYIKGGTQLALVMAVDFTSSNGYPHRNDSLHTLNPVNGLNSYQKAMSSCGEILLNYDYDKMVPVYGFGGRPKFPLLSTQQTMHCFPLNGKPNDPYCFSLEGIMESYNYALHNVELNGPTLFCPILTEVMKICIKSKTEGDDQYYILMILTDGEIHDMEQTIKAIVDSSHLPLSIIIIGIGNADFTNMDILDGDEGLWDSAGRKAQRDLVQFVPFNKFAGDSTALAAHVLEELPLQLTEYMRLAGKMPGKVENISISVNAMNFEPPKSNNIQKPNNNMARPMLGLYESGGSGDAFTEELKGKGFYSEERNQVPQGNYNMYGGQNSQKKNNSYDFKK